MLLVSVLSRWRNCGFGGGLKCLRRYGIKRDSGIENR
jgi:hypothetical protein